MRKNIFQKVSYAGLVSLEFNFWASKLKTFLKKQVVGVATTCYRMAYEQHTLK
jgi:hypothetical protein